MSEDTADGAVSSPPGSCWPVINRLVAALDDENVAGERQARILADVMTSAGINLDYDVDMAMRAYDDRPWVYEAARRASERIKEAQRERAKTAEGDRPAGPALPERRSVSASTPPARGRRGAGRAGADKPDA